MNCFKVLVHIYVFPPFHTWNEPSNTKTTEPIKWCFLLRGKVPFWLRITDYKKKCKGILHMKSTQVAKINNYCKKSNNYLISTRNKCEIIGLYTLGRKTVTFTTFKQFLHILPNSYFTSVKHVAPIYHPILRELCHLHFTDEERFSERLNEWLVHKVTLLSAGTNQTNPSLRVLNVKLFLPFGKNR